MTLPPLPKLPEPAHKICHSAARGEFELAYTADQLRTYAEQYGRLCAEAERDRLQARVAELEVDAERYRWLRAHKQDVSCWDGGDVLELEQLDAAIDTARKAKP